eukprot:992035-Prymnesium_polylepis.2
MPSDGGPQVLACHVAGVARRVHAARAGAVRALASPPIRDWSDSLTPDTRFCGSKCRSSGGTMPSSTDACAQPSGTTPLQAAGKPISPPVSGSTLTLTPFFTSRGEETAVSATERSCSTAEMICSPEPRRSSFAWCRFTFASTCDGDSARLSGAPVSAGERRSRLGSGGLGQRAWRGPTSSIGVQPSRPASGL